jgi:TM2 domain-containing membrane protein YozV/ribosomal protein L37AE/L43A
LPLPAITLTIRGNIESAKGLAAVVSRVDEIRSMSRPHKRTLEDIEAELEGRTRCPVCDEDISARARKCKHCGEALDPTLARTPACAPATVGKSMPAPHSYTRTKSKVAAFLFAWFLGGIGGHKFYLGRVGQGVLYLLFFWTFIPAILSFIEGIIYITMDDERFWQKYG